MNNLRNDLFEILNSPGVAEGDLRSRVVDALIKAPPPPPKITYAEFMAWADEDTLAEWVNGEVVMTSPASRKHQEIAGFLLQITNLYCQANDLGVILLAPFQMKLANSGREPDLIFVARARLNRLHPTYLDGPADLVVEVTSPESVGRDRGDKFYEYEQAGISEYWLVDPQREQAEFYRLDAHGRYQFVLPDEEGVYRSQSIAGFWFPVAWLWDLPPVVEAIRQLGLV